MAGQGRREAQSDPGRLAVPGGKTLLKVLPLEWITRVAAVVMVAPSAVSVVGAVGA